MCLLLYASTTGTAGNKHMVSQSPYLMVSPVSDADHGDYYGVLRLFRNRSVWLVVSDEGCACNMGLVIKAVEDTTGWPEDLAAAVRSEHQRSLMRLEALQGFCRDIALDSKDQEVQIFAYWADDPMEIAGTRAGGLEAFFGRDEVHFEDGHLYILTLPN